MNFEPTILKLGKKFKWVNKILGFLCAGLMVTFAILNFGFTGKPINQVIMMFYYLLFAALILACEFNFKSTLKLFGFLGNLFGKGVFVLLVGISMFGDSFSLKTIIAIILMIGGLIYILFFFLPNKLLQDTAGKYAGGTTAN